ncbi:unnamed protein product, partial [Albugo candida]
KLDRLAYQVGASEQYVTQTFHTRMKNMLYSLRHSSTDECGRDKIVSSDFDAFESSNCSKLGSISITFCRLTLIQDFAPDKELSASEAPNSQRHQSALFCYHSAIDLPN